MRKIKQGAIPDEVMEFALSEMQKILSGEIVFVAQDGRLIQVEVTQRRRLFKRDDLNDRDYKR